MKLFWCSGGGRCDEALREREKENRAFRNVPDKTKDKEEDLALRAGDHCRADVRKLSVQGEKPKSLLCLCNAALAENQLFSVGVAAV